VFQLYNRQTSHRFQELLILERIVLVQRGGIPLCDHFIPVSVLPHHVCNLDAEVTLAKLHHLTLIYSR